MAVTLNASTSSGFIATSDTSGSLELQANGTTKATVSSSGLAIGQYNPSASLITRGTAQNSTSGTSIDFTGIPSWVKRITVMFNGVSTNGTSNLIVQLGTSSGVTTSGYVGQVNFYGQSSNTSGFALSDGFRIVQNTAAGAIYGTATLFNISGNNWVGSTNIDATSSGYASQANGSIALAATLDRVRITMQNGTDTFDAGSINILYE